MISRSGVTLLIALIASLFLAAQSAKGPEHQRYTWKNVQIVGGGFVDGIIFHPKEKGLHYARTDIGGSYRWNEQSKRWEPLLDWVSYPDLNLMGVAKYCDRCIRPGSCLSCVRNLYQPLDA